MGIVQIISRLKSVTFLLIRMRLIFLFALCFCCASAWIDGDWCFPGAKLTECSSLNGVGKCVKKICNDNNEWEEGKPQQEKKAETCFPGVMEEKCSVMSGVEKCETYICNEENEWEVLKPQQDKTAKTPSKFLTKMREAVQRNEDSVN